MLRVVGDGVFRDDPLRLLRLPRLAAELEFARRPRHRRASPGATRTWPPRRRASGSWPSCSASSASATRSTPCSLCDELGVLTAVLPEVDALHDVEQSAFHHLDVFHHTLHVIDAAADVAANVGHFFPDPAVAAAIEASLAAPLDGTMDVRAGLRWGALLHDIAKPYTRTVMPDGGVKFWGHDERGVAMLGRHPRPLQRQRRAARADDRAGRPPPDARLHDPGASARPPRRLPVRGGDTCPYALPSVVLSLGDRLATRGSRTRQRGLRRHLETAQELAAAIVALGPVPPRLVAPADRIAEQIGLTPGPELGRLVAALQEEQAAGAVETEGQAVEFARSWLASSA